jgi:hypothetical protein
MPQPYTLSELKDVLNAEFATFQLGNAPMTAMDGTNVYLCGVTNTPNWAPLSVLQEAQNWWLNVKHRELMQSNENYRRNMGPSWSPPRSWDRRGRRRATRRCVGRR